MRHARWIDRLNARAYTALALFAAVLWGLIEWAALSRNRWRSR